MDDNKDKTMGYIMNDGEKFKYVDMSVKALFQRTPSEEALQCKLDNLAAMICGLARIGDGSRILRLKPDGDGYVVQQLMIKDNDAYYDDFPMLKGLAFRIEEIGFILDGIMLGHAYAMCQSQSKELQNFCLS